jgi:hypothetical protein
MSAHISPAAAPVPVPHRPLGCQGLRCSAQGLGCMGMTGSYALLSARCVDSILHRESVLHIFASRQLFTSKTQRSTKKRLCAPFRRRWKGETAHGTLIFSIPTCFLRRSGVNMLDTAWIYQNQAPDGVTHYNESLVGRALEKFGREKFGTRVRQQHRVGDVC